MYTRRKYNRHTKKEIVSIGGVPSYTKYFYKVIELPWKFDFIFVAELLSEMTYP